MPYLYIYTVYVTGISAHIHIYIYVYTCSCILLIAPRKVRTPMAKLTTKRPNETPEKNDQPEPKKQCTSGEAGELGELYRTKNVFKVCWALKDFQRW